MVDPGLHGCTAHNLVPRAIVVTAPPSRANPYLHEVMTCALDVRIEL